ncbi:hypothetical protein K503DRAFT_405733 [Rhizopogon vinicolor AM-OR11-026]|uniref:Uncharacterized protein n=1 Tax=Rhizopogon vinicolor AM-OR11-026 TaxID=1314800 RepID=A0A1B7MQT2_9AGAM|nr:hypothetical protein K503DRAFT_405733 [Rhizopogon vinicolor AM-OR11-026]
MLYIDRHISIGQLVEVYQAKTLYRSRGLHRLRRTSHQPRTCPRGGTLLHSLQERQSSPPAPTPWPFSS